jgi:hypothetical protein
MTTETAAAPPTADEQDAAAEPLFDREELKQFGADDVEAGQAICKMLSLFFFYTLVAMGAMTLVTYRGCMGEW